jgi:hypothetical protein
LGLPIEKEGKMYIRDFLVPITLSLISSFVLSFIFFLLAIIKKVQAKNSRITTQKYLKRLDDLVINIETVGAFPPASIYEVGSSSVISEKEIQDLIEKRTEDIRSKIEQIETRLPNEAILDKLSSVNDAILATHIEELRASLRRLEDRTMTPRGVAGIVSLILGSLGGLLMLALKVLRP